MFTISLFGNSIRVFESIISIEDFIKIKELSDRFGIDLTTCFLDLDFLNQIGYKHWSEVGEVKEHHFFELTHSNFIEIKNRSKRILKIKAKEIENEGLLFPRFLTQQSNFVWKDSSESVQKILICQYETGCFGKFKIDTPSFDLDQLYFDLAIVNLHHSSNLLTLMTYNEQPLISTYNDSLIRSLSSILVS